MRPDDKNQASEDFALGEALRRSAAPVPPAKADLRARIAALADQRPARRTQRFFLQRALPLSAALAAGLLLHWAGPFGTGSREAVTASVEESYVWETFSEAFDEAESAMPWDDTATD